MRTIRATSFFLTLLASAASAVDVCAYGFVNCSTFQGSGCCRNLAQGGCCDWSTMPAVYGLSVQFIGIPAGMTGWGYNSANCKNPLAGTDSGCMGFAGNPARSGKWIGRGQPTRFRRDESAATKCVAPDYVQFVGKDGEVHEFDIPEGKAAEVGRLLESNDVEALSRFEKK